jgi:hypothetical protein
MIITGCRIEVPEDDDVDDEPSDVEVSPAARHCLDASGTSFEPGGLYKWGRPVDLAGLFG